MGKHCNYPQTEQYYTQWYRHPYKAQFTCVTFALFSWEIPLHLQSTQNLSFPRRAQSTYEDWGYAEQRSTHREVKEWCIPYFICNLIHLVFPNIKPKLSHHVVTDVQVVKYFWYVNERMWVSGLACLWAVSHGMTNIYSALYKYCISYLPCGSVVTEVEERAGKPVIDFI